MFSETVSFKIIEAEALVNIRTYHLCIIEEATEIIKHFHKINCEDGYKVSKIWLQPFFLII
jgi:hypothetical protein